MQLFRKPCRCSSRACRTQHLLRRGMNWHGLTSVSVAAPRTTWTADHLITTAVPHGRGPAVRAIGQDRTATATGRENVVETPRRIGRDLAPSPHMMIGRRGRMMTGPRGRTNWPRLFPSWRNWSVSFPASPITDYLARAAGVRFWRVIALGLPRLTRSRQAQAGSGIHHPFACTPASGYPRLRVKRSDSTLTRMQTVGRFHLSRNHARLFRGQFAGSIQCGVSNGHS